MDSSDKTVVSLFACGGVGDLGFRKAGIKTILMNELLEERALIAHENFPESAVVVGDINEVKNDIVNKLKGKDIFILSATPPCQGMSKNGIGTILKAMRDNKRPKIDERNYLYIPTIEIAERLRPHFIFFENVDRFLNTYVIDERGNEVSVSSDFILRAEKIGYKGDFSVINASDFGVAQNRLRTVGIFYDSKRYSIPDVTQLFSVEKKKKLTITEAIGHLPPLDSKDSKVNSSKIHPLHKVSVARPDLYYWISNTPKNKSAFDNSLCPNCNFENEKDKTLVYCIKCETLLPKPVVEDKDGKLRVIKGFTSAYKRMNALSPAHTVTTRFCYAGSDRNIHPTQNRVLSPYEAALLQGINPEDYKWNFANGKKATSTLIRELIGEAVPPQVTETFGTHLLKLSARFKL